MKRYRIAQVGCGDRGKIHIKGFLANKERYEYVGLCDLDEFKLKDAASRFKITTPLYADAEKMLSETKPDILCFVTPPHARLPLVKLGVKYGVKGILFEKPMATSLSEAKAITDLCINNNIKATVCHQHKYLPGMKKLKSIIDSGDIGQIKKIHINARAWMAELGTHYLDYALWAAGGPRAIWVAGHVHGRYKLTSSHPSADFGYAVILLENGIRLYFECGYLSEQNLSDDEIWLDDRLTVYGTHGFAWAEANGAWQAMTKSSGGKLLEGQFLTWVEYMDYMQAEYIREFADWLDNDEKVHPCNIEISYRGYEILEAIYLSALGHTRTDLPITDMNFENSISRALRELPEIRTYIPNPKLNI